MLKKLIQTRILGEFYSIDLTSFEQRMADEAVAQKYAPAISQAIVLSTLLIPALLLLDTSIVVSVLIPTTMVAGTAWFSVSLASMKKKFEDFGMELTKHLFVAFTLSLVMLLLATSVSLTSAAWKPFIPPIAEHPASQLGAAALAVFVVGALLYSIFAGSLKYDINDAMLTGQNEVAERFFKQSLSLLFITAQQLRGGMPLQVANYYLGLCFYEVFNNIRELNSTTLENSDALVDQANSLISEPSMSQVEADNVVLDMIDSFTGSCSRVNEVHSHRSYRAIEFELNCLQRDATRKEGPGGAAEADEGDRQMVDIRMSVILSEISNLIEEFGPTLFDSDTNSRASEKPDHSSSHEGRST